MDSADLTVSVWANNLTGQDVKVTKKGAIENMPLSRRFILKAGEKKEIIFKPENYPALHIVSPRIWWPYPLGEQNLYSLH
jgi:exo-1,4-beta-D-glucosaminidase